MGSSKEYIEKNREKIKDYMHKYYLEHKKKIINNVYEWRRNNPDKVREQNKIRNNTIKAVIRRNRWIEKNPEKNRLSKIKYARENYIKNKELINIRQKAQKILTNSKCDICGSTSHLERHHWRYDQPLNVNTLCKSCHTIQHLKNFNAEIFRGGEIH